MYTCLHGDGNTKELLTLPCNLPVGHLTQQIIFHDQLGKLYGRRITVEYTS